MRVCVFGSSSSKTSQRFVDSAFKLGEIIATRKHICVNGGGMHGCMGAVTKGTQSMNGDVIGVIHEKWCVDGDEDRSIQNMIIVGGDDLEERKKLLLENGDCVIALPGGVGTFDEIWDCVCGKSLDMKGMSRKPICLINTDGFYDGFVIQMERAHKEGLLYGPADSFYFLADDVESGLNWCEDQYKQNKSQLDEQRRMKNLSAKGITSRKSKKSEKEKEIRVGVINVQRNDGDEDRDEKDKDNEIFCDALQSSKSYTTARSSDREREREYPNSSDSSKGFGPAAYAYLFSSIGFGIIVGMNMAMFHERRRA